MPRLSSLIISGLILLLAACSPRGMLTYSDQTNSGADQEHIFVASTRQKADGALGFTADRDAVPNYAAFTVSVPPEHQVGRIEWPGARANPARHFVTTERQDFASARVFRSDLDRALASQPPGRRDVIVFVHGYNNTFAEGLYRVAQLGHDLNVNAVKVHYSWPSAGTGGGYAYDRDSAAFARDGLEALLALLANSRAERVVLVAHSMGALLTVETLRQAYIPGRPAIARKLGGVVLISPDIDVDLFKTQLGRIRPLPRPFVIFSSREDKALRLSALLTGEADRLGNLRSPDELKNFGVTVVDISDYADGSDWLNHSTFATSPDLLAILAALPELDRRLDPGTQGATGLATLRARVRRGG